MKELTSAQRFIIDKLYDGYTISTTTQDNLLNNIIVVSAYIDSHIRSSICMTANEVNNLIKSNLIIMESENDKSYIYFKLSPHPKYIKTQLIKPHTRAHYDIKPISLIKLIIISIIIILIFMILSGLLAVSILSGLGYLP